MCKEFLRTIISCLSNDQEYTQIKNLILTVNYPISKQEMDKINVGGIKGLKTIFTVMIILMPIAMALEYFDSNKPY